VFFWWWFLMCFIEDFLLPMKEFASRMQYIASIVRMSDSFVKWTPCDRSITCLSIGFILRIEVDNLIEIREIIINDINYFFAHNDIFKLNIHLKDKRRYYAIIIFYDINYWGCFNLDIFVCYRLMYNYSSAATRLVSVSIKLFFYSWNINSRFIYKNVYKMCI